MNLSLFVSFLLFLLTAFYSVTVVGLMIGLQRLRYARSSTRPSVSIIVAARNEEKNLEALLQQLVRQDYPDVEIIIVDDRSTDGTARIIDSFSQKYSSLRRMTITSIDADMPAKKNALARGIKASRGEILCFTDADCVPTTRWVSEVVSCFDTDAGLVAGFSPYDSKLLKETFLLSFFQKTFYKFIEYEEFKGGIWSAGSIGLQKGWLCTGRNLAYRRVVYDQVGGFEKIKHSISGDDDLFLQLVRRETRWKIRYATSPESFVRTVPPKSFSHFVEQRKRHFSAAKYFPLSMKIFFFLFHSANLILFLGLLGWLSGVSSLREGVWFYLTKIVMDSALFVAGTSVFNGWVFAAYFLFMEILYIFYNAFIGPLGFFKTFRWKPEPK